MKNIIQILIRHSQSKSQDLGLRSIAVGGSQALLQRARNLSSSLDHLLDNVLLLDHLLIKRHLQTHLQALQSDPNPPQSKGVRCSTPNKFFQIGSGLHAAVGPRMDRRVVTSLRVVNFSRLNNVSPKVFRNGKCVDL